MKKRLLILIFICLNMIFSGCGSSNKETNEAPELPLEGTSSAFIEASEGGRVSSKAADGAVVSVVFPPKALPKSSEVKLSVEIKEGNDVLYLVTIYPVEIKLYEAASIIVEFPGSIGGTSDVGLFALIEEAEEVPLKQVLSDKDAAGRFYSFGQFTCSRFDIDDCLYMAAKMRNAKTPENWQDLLTVFNGIVWVGEFFNKTNEIEDALACFEDISALCRDGLDFFIKKEVPEENDALVVYKKALEKYKYIQRLSSDEEVLLKKLDEE